MIPSRTRMWRGQCSGHHRVNRTAANTGAGRAPWSRARWWMSTDNLLSRKGLRRAATAGLAVGLAALATLTLGGVHSTERATAEVRESNRVSSAWESVFVEVSRE